MAKGGKLDLSAGVVSSPIDLSAGIQKAPVSTPSPSALSPHGGPTDALRGAGAGIEQMVMHPINTIAGMGLPAIAGGTMGMYPGTAPMPGKMGEEAAKSQEQMQMQAQKSQEQQAHEMAQHPMFTLGSVVGPALLTAGIMKGPELLDRIGGPVSDVASAFGIPTKTHALNVLGDIAETAGKTPVEPLESSPAIEKFREYVETGGKQSKPVFKLGQRIAPMTERQAAISEAKGPFTYEEAREFYPKISRASARPGFLRRAIENPETPEQRMQIGNVREGLQSDIAAAAEKHGLGQDYLNAEKEYARAAKIHSMVKKAAAGLAAEEIMRRTGILGRIGSHLMR